VTLDQAAEFAMALIRSLRDATVLPGGESILDQAEQQHGSRIDWASIRLEEPVGYVTQSPYSPLEDSIPIYVRRLVGPHYLIGLRSQGRLVASVAVAAHTTGYYVNNRGRLRTPAEPGNAFFTIGVSASTLTHHPLHPEEAVIDVATRTGARVAELPVLVQWPVGVSAHGSGWQLVLDREVELTTSDGARQRSRQIHIFSDPFGGTPVWRIPAAEQPTTYALEYAIRPNFETRTATLEIRRGYPVSFLDIVRPGLHAPLRM
jgi:hypothetical protein